MFCTSINSIPPEIAAQNRITKVETRCKELAASSDFVYLAADDALEWVIWLQDGRSMVLACAGASPGMNSIIVM